MRPSDKQKELIETIGRENSLYLILNTKDNRDENIISESYRMLDQHDFVSDIEYYYIEDDNHTEIESFIVVEFRSTDKVWYEEVENNTVSDIDNDGYNLKFGIKTEDEMEDLMQADMLFSCMGYEWDTGMALNEHPELEDTDFEMVREWNLDRISIREDDERVSVMTV